MILVKLFHNIYLTGKYKVIFFQKKESFDNYDDLTVKNIQYKINRRPRKKLNFDSPKNIFFKKVAFVT